MSGWTPQKTSYRGEKHHQFGKKFKHTQEARDKISSAHSMSTEDVNDRIDKILSSGIDFTTYGWVGEVSELIEVKPQGVSRWMKKYMPEFYETCYVRKSK